MKDVRYSKVVKLWQCTKVGLNYLMTLVLSLEKWYVYVQKIKETIKKKSTILGFQMSRLKQDDWNKEKPINRNKK